MDELILNLILGPMVTIEFKEYLDSLDVKSKSKIISPY